MHEYRVETVENLPPASHQDYVYRSVRVQMTRLEDQRPFLLKIRQSLGLKVGDVVRLSQSMVRMSQFEG